MKLSMTGQEKGDCLIGVTAWAGYLLLPQIYSLMPQIKPVYNCNFISPIEMPPVLLGIL
jgi:hypothetical protein